MVSATLNHSKPRRRSGSVPTGRQNLVPLLDNGFRLAQPEFHRRYELMPEVKRAELIEGIVFMSSPVSFVHARATQAVHTWIGTYAVATPGAEAVDNATLILDPDNEFQPDIMLRLDEAHGGKSRLVDKYLHGAPELIIEVALTSVAQDLHGKFNVYRRLGVPEYLVWQLEQQRMDWFICRKVNIVQWRPPRMVCSGAGCFQDYGWTPKPCWPGI